MAVTDKGQLANTSTIKKGDGNMNKVMAVVFATLQELGQPVHRTKLVKLVYLADNLFYEHFGRTMTGLQYMWDDFGPNAISNAIVKETDKLLKRDMVCLKTSPNMYGGESYIYSLGPQPTAIPETLLDKLERYVIKDVVSQYGKYGVREIVSASKKTPPFRQARQYGVLQLAQCAEFVELEKAVRSDLAFMEGIREAMQPGAEAKGLTLEEVRRKYALA